MYEIIFETEVNYIYNNSIYTDKSIGEIDTGYEIDVFENDIYKIMVVPTIDVQHLLEIKIYRKNSEIFEICRLDFFKNQYINSSYNKSFRLNSYEIDLINKSTHSNIYMDKILNRINLQLAVLSNSYEIFSNLQISSNDFIMYDLKSLD